MSIPELLRTEFAHHWRLVFGSTVFALVLTLATYAFALFPNAAAWVKLLPISFVLFAHVALAGIVVVREGRRLLKGNRYKASLDYRRHARWYVEQPNGNVVLVLTVTVVNRSGMTWRLMPEEKYAYVIDDAPDGAVADVSVTRSPRTQALRTLYQYGEVFNLEGYRMRRTVQRFEVDGDGLRPGEGIEYSLRVQVAANFERWLGARLGEEDFFMIFYWDDPREVTIQLDMPPGFVITPSRLEVWKPDIDHVDKQETHRFQLSNTKLVSESGSPLIWRSVRPLPGFRYFCFYRVSKRPTMIPYPGSFVSPATPSAELPAPPA